LLFGTSRKSKLDYESEPDLLLYAIRENLVPFANDSGAVAMLEQEVGEPPLRFDLPPDDSAFQPSPIDPKWILDGNPVARSIPLVKSADGLFTGGHWDCTAGRFKYYYTCDEIVRIAEGSAMVELNGTTRTLQQGDVALFSEGDVAIWTVHVYVRKLAVFRIRQKSLWSRVARKLGSSVRSIFRPASS
jgi:uncharacterized cupin superfamily protein